MIREWTELTRLTGGSSIVVEKVRLADSGIAIEGEFALPRLAQLEADDQVFVMAFVSAHGSLKDMERMFGISYPTVKNRLDKLAGKLKMVEFTPAPEPEVDKEDVLGMLERGEINAEEAVRRLS
ncbi:DUF2089 domain-containing protein [Dehalogenimonas etheniformans]|uniref:DUF2089 domain-containing protein n=1 Tax=Dehalogenimonas etheniformans TaxID=1536648 RepID=A0A2P5P8C2_9CHLR|nr:DUF2089 domain-containing protein [Dehalogenimonas etheniformans]PPD58544.1 DUF2089 domain-containing protein [Dehalogenimonas etheniformans]QNT76692.1 DUF2089 domain-containing protein [Dehalogenimonas etheniformans]